MEALRMYLLTVLAGWTSGISLYLTVAILGIFSRAGWIDLPGNLNTLSNPFVIGLALILYFIEFIADKIPFVDSAWDSVHTLIRPAGAAAAGYLAGSGDGAAIQTALALAAGTFALDAHALKASTRLAINTSPEPFSNIAASLAEHSFVIFIFWFFIKHPVWACVIILTLAVLSIWLLRILWRFVRAVFKKIFGGAAKPTSDPEATGGN